MRDRRKGYIENVLRETKVTRTCSMYSRETKGRRTWWDILIRVRRYEDIEDILMRDKIRKEDMEDVLIRVRWQKEKNNCPMRDKSQQDMEDVFIRDR
jgi:hypothetical protein